MIPAPRPEAELLLHCVRVRLPTSGRERIRQISGAHPDWEEFLSLATRHGLMAPAYERLNEIVPEVLPKAVMVKLWAARQRTLSQNAEISTELINILEVFDAVGIVALPYKGPTLALELYGDVGLRQFGDLDILVRPEDVLPARERLTGMGYVAEYPLKPAVERAFLRSGAQYHLAMQHAKRGLKVELHWRIDPDIDIATEKPDAKRFRSRELLLVLLVHGSRHRWSSLGWLVDAAELMARDKVDWPWILARARALGCQRRVALGVLLAQALLEAPVPPEVITTCRAQEGIEGTAAAVAQDLLALNARDRTPREMLHDDLALYDTRRQRTKHLLDTFWKPSLVEWSRWPLPRVLFFLYPPLRLLRLSGKHAAARARPQIPAGATPRTPSPPPRSKG